MSLNASATRLFLGAGRPWFALGCAVAIAAPHAHAADGKRVALVVGIGEYPNLPPELRLPHARQDAEALARALRERAGFEVMELLDGFATRQAIESFLVQSLPGMVGPADTLLIYVEAHGMGADFDDPYVLTYDAKPGEVEATAMSVAELGRRVREAVNVRALVVITDTAHAGELGGLALLGPHAKSWPDLPENTMILSASSPREPTVEGLFAPILVRAFSGEADASRDGLLTASELHRFVVEKVPEASGDQVHPAEAGDYAPGLALCPIAAPVSPPPDVVAATEVPPPALPAEPPSEPRERHRRWGVALPALGGALALGAGSLVALGRGRALSPVVYHEAGVPDGEEYSSYYERYVKWHRANWALGAGAWALAATGGFFALVPIQEGAAAEVSLRF